MNRHNGEKILVHFIGGEGINWALDEDLKLAKACVPDFVDIADFDKASVIYSVWPGAIEAVDPAKLVGKKVICEFDNPPHHWIKQTHFRKARKYVSLWITHSSQAFEQAKALGLPSMIVPYRLDKSIFFPQKENNELGIKLLERYDIPLNRYVIGNFHRDSEGENLHFPKLQKGPDIFFQIVLDLFKKNYPIHILLAGPRRHWLRNQLKYHGVPYTFVGNLIDTDDINQNILPRETLNDLYACLDLVLITSRWEGGPYSILEGVATRCKVVSSRVGLAEDVLKPESIFDSVDQAVSIVENDIKLGTLANTIDAHHERFLQNYTFTPARKALANVFLKIHEYPKLTSTAESGVKQVEIPSSNWRRLMRHLGFGKNNFSQKTVSILREFHKPPYGGGNQFMLALKGEFEKIGVRVLNNEISNYVDAYLFDSVWFDLRLLDKLSRIKNPRVGHRIDGPIHLYRGKDKEMDDCIFEINRRFATVSIIQSIYTLRSIINSGYSPISPIVIPNSVNPNIFYRQENKSKQENKIKLISTSWSDNPMKGADDYKWMDENLDFNKYSYTFYGRIKQDFKNILVKQPVPSEELANLLRQHDLYITASRNDPCSNALLEALACGLPTLYKNSGGHPELVGFAGLPYDQHVEIPQKLKRLTESSNIFSGCIAVEPSRQIAKRYLEALFIE